MEKQNDKSEAYQAAGSSHAWDRLSNAADVTGFMRSEKSYHRLYGHYLCDKVEAGLGAGAIVVLLILALLPHQHTHMAENLSITGDGRPRQGFPACVFCRQRLHMRHLHDAGNHHEHCKRVRS